MRTYIYRPLLALGILAGLHLPALVFSDAAADLSQLSETIAFHGIRLQHAKELLGSSYSRSVVRHGEEIVDIDLYIYRWTERALRPQFKKKAKSITEAILAQSKKHGFDPVFLMGVIENESSFDPTIVGSVGEIGLMQIRPSTAEWLASKQGWVYRGKNSLFDPVQNIEIGAGYLAYLRDEFKGHSRNYLAAYNMGVHGVRRSIAQNEKPTFYPRRVMQRYVRFYEDLRKWKHAVAIN